MNTFQLRTGHTSLEQQLNTCPHCNLDTSPWNSLQQELNTCPHFNLDTRPGLRQKVQKTCQLHTVGKCPTRCTLPPGIQRTHRLGAKVKHTQQLRTEKRWATARSQFSVQAPHDFDCTPPGLVRRQADLYNADAPSSGASGNHHARPDAISLNPWAFQIPHCSQIKGNPSSSSRRSSTFHVQSHRKIPPQKKMFSFWRRIQRSRHHPHFWQRQSAVPSRAHKCLSLST